MNKVKSITALVGLVFILQSCSKPVSPRYLGYQNFRMEKIGFGKNVLGTDVKLYNPNSYALQLKSANIELFINSAFLGKSVLDSLIILPPKDTTYIPMRLEASAKDILSNTVKILINPDVKIKITGTARAGRHGFFITIPIDYEGVQRIQLAGNN